ncbi:bifunctional serine/threonine-protein kinase/formylglycine-generating enzyme family protein [Planctobacterium marinum]|uniref:Protein kinase domain-containing protein n=1 Tax=Planctobacterium marinum TaxID=1631968 RepID=A0AA48HXF2_9ALTE|nr:hypothetical protein MACH26_18910 [Planctobacterium marinum]
MDTIGKYKVIKELGAGGFGAVYLAEAPITNAQVAIKIFQVKDENLAGVATSASQDASGVLKERFLSEARTLEQLSHNPYIVSIRDYDELDDGTPYYVMPYLPTSLEQEIGKDAFTQGKLEETPKSLHPRKLASNRAIEILKQILEGMSEVHRAGLIHRDIKPANILFDAQGNVQICDFGIAKLPDAEHSQSGVGMGSRNYVSPEQRESAKHVSPASDVYSIGVLVYRMLTGQLPLGKFQDAIAYAPEIGEELNVLIDDALSQNEQERPADAGVFLNRFNQAVSGFKENIVKEEGTGTWINEGKTEIKPELKPLKQRIENLLSEQGEIREKDKPGLDALASVIGLNEEALSEFIVQTTAAHAQSSVANAGLLKWVDGINRRATDDNKTPRKNITQEEYDALIEVGISTTGQDKGALERLLKEKGIAAGQERQSAESKTQQAPRPAQDTPQPPQETKMPGGILGAALAGSLAIVLLVGFISYFVGGDQSADPQINKSTPRPSTAVQSLLDSMVTIPGGSFIMGSNDGGSNGKPVHRVSIKPFKLMETEVTWSMYQPCIDDGVCPEAKDEGWGKGNRPVINVRWNDITQKYIPWLNQQTGQTFRLPTEAEWEYAARGGTQTPFNTGNCINIRQANYDGNYDYNNCGAKTGTNLEKTTQVKSYKANPFGLYDMHGNVWEFVQDCWNDSYIGAPGDGSAWMEGDCGQAVLRGGSWGNGPDALRLASRISYFRTNRHDTVGLRLAQDL